MIEVTCFQCRTRVRISPGSYLCPKCEQDLRQLLSQEQVSGYFYNRASALAVNGEFQAALEEVEHGLTFYGSAELHLLAAILSQQLGRYDQMRHHVAAIPLEDSLRSEAEWLLRSHQDRQRALREGLRVDRNVRRGGIQANRSIMVEELSGRTPGTTPAAVRRAGLLRMFAVSSVVIFSLIILAVAASELFPEQVAQVWSGLPFTTASDRPTVGLPASGSLDDPATGILPAEPGDPSELDPALGTGNLTLIAPDAPQLAAELIEILRNANRQDLLDLELTIRVDDGRAIVEGQIEREEQRGALSFLLPVANPINLVDVTGLQVRVPTTYVVQPGDTLWTIVFNLYGNVDRLDEVIEANRDILPAPEALQPGMELRIPQP